MGHPRIPVVGVVFDQEETAAGPQMSQKTPENRLLVADEMQRVGHQDAVQSRKLERACEVGLDVANVRRWKRRSHPAMLLGQRASVPIDRHDRAATAEQIRQRKGERAGARAKVGPGARPVRDTVTNQRDVIGVVQW